jgi:hypothetical protein
MGLWSLLVHLANFVLPAVAVGTALAFLVPVFARKRAPARSLLVQAATNSIAGVAMLVAGLVVFGNDGKMASYGALVVAIGTAQWWGLRR